MGAGVKKCPGKTDQALASVRLCPRPVASRDGDQVGVQRMFDYIARVELVGIGLGRKNYRRFERPRAAGGAVSRKMKVRKRLGLACQEASGGCVPAGKFGALRWRKISAPARVS